MPTTVKPLPPDASTFVRRSPRCRGPRYRFADTLRARLAVDLPAVDRDGWDSPQGSRLLIDVRDLLVVPCVARADLRDPVEAVGVGWTAAWRALCRPGIRAAREPYIALWVDVTREITRHDMHLSQFTLRHSDRPFALVGEDTALLDTPAPPVTELDDSLGPRLDLIRDALVEAGWDRAIAGELLCAIAARVRTVGGPDGVREWGLRRGLNDLAAELGIQRWQASRVWTLVLGGPGGPGVLHRMVIDGDHVLGEPDAQRALASTISHDLRPPAHRRRAAGARIAV